jgi:hypothetical protein
MDGKKYENKVEERFRMKIFLKNREAIVKHNRKSDFYGYELGKLQTTAVTSNNCNLQSIQ